MATNTNQQNFIGYKQNQQVLNQNYNQQLSAQQNAIGAPYQDWSTTTFGGTGGVSGNYTATYANSTTSMSLVQEVLEIRKEMVVMRQLLEELLKEKIALKKLKS